MAYTALCNLALPTSPEPPPSALRITHCASVPLLLEHYHPCLRAAACAGCSLGTSCSQISRATLSWHSSAQHCLFNEVFANIQYQWAPHPWHCPATTFRFTLFCFIYRTRHHLTFSFVYLLIYCLWLLPCDKCHGNLVSHLPMGSNNSNSASHITICINAMKLTVLRCLSTNLTVLQKLLRLTLRGSLRCKTCVFANVQCVNTDPAVDTIEFWNRSCLDRWLRLRFPSHGLKGQRDFVSLVRKSQTTILDAMDSCMNATEAYLLSAKDCVSIHVHLFMEANKGVCLPNRLAH